MEEIARVLAGILIVLMMLCIGKVIAFFIRMENKE